MLSLALEIAGLMIGCAGLYELVTGKSTGLLKSFGLRSERIAGFDHGSFLMMAGGILLAVGILLP